MSDELRAAALSIQGGYCTRTMEYAKKLADAYLTEHPADDSEPVTEEWLLSHGWEQRQEPSRLTGCTIVCPNTNQDIRWGPSQGFWISMYNAKTIKTRGDVRRLCAALGIELKL